MDADAPAHPSEDSHVHTQWSWDAPRGDMHAACAAAVAAGLSAVAFTEHADFNEIEQDPRAVVDLTGYLRTVDECRDRFPELVIRSGVELGQPHLFPAETAALLGSAGTPLDRVLGSMHVGEVDGRLVDISWASRQLHIEQLPDLVRSTLRLTHDMLRSDASFEILAHLDYAKRYWPHDALVYDPLDFEDEYRAVLDVAAGRGTVLEINTTRGEAPHRGLGPSLTVLRWWHEAGGTAVSFGSDAHSPGRVGGGLTAAADLAAAAGFHPSIDGAAYWGRRAQA